MKSSIRKQLMYDEMPAMKTISASIIQGSAIGPASYVVNSSDLNPVSADNELCKYADDTCIIIHAVSVNMRSSEIKHIRETRVIRPT